ncbi:HlyD family efflux transporter periplasmic adaptor subunit [Verrucomicrobiaceae bacterium R5-34]|nr:HlyD family efflux transporter periplasmic adaptor subunit [Verrucomicrobiaceae bacterium R5-34]
MKIKQCTAPRGSVTRKLPLILVLLALVAGGIWYLTREPESELPAGIVSGNGRIEADQVDISTKYPGRVSEILVDEGELVKPGQVLARMDDAEIKTQLARAKAQLASAKESIKEVEALIAQKKSSLTLAEQELQRALPLVEKGVMSQRVGEQRKALRDSAKAALAAAMAHLETAKSTTLAAEATVNQIQVQLDECVLKSTTQGRVLYRLAETGEVLGAGGKILTLLDLSEIHMEVFLPSADSGKIAIGSEARITLDAASSEYAIPAVVSFVSPEAQFTPKQVETLNERQKLMFRVHIRIPQELVLRHIDKVKTGVRGMGYIRLDDSVAWPEALEKRYPGDQPK